MVGHAQNLSSDAHAQNAPSGHVNQTPRTCLEYASAALTLFERADGARGWLATSLTAEDVLELPEVGAAVPVAELYAGLDFADAGGLSAPQP